MKRQVACIIVFIASILFWKNMTFANDTAAGITATGLFFKEEKNISIVKEDLYISKDKIEVTYVFRNHSNKDIKTEIAFPIPEYSYDISGNTFYPMYDDFSVEVNGKRIQHNEEARAFLNNIEYTQLLNAMGISIKDFGNTIHDPNKSRPETEKESFFEDLSDNQKQVLLDKKLVLSEEKTPIWTVSRKYHWNQTFPANKTITIRHSYTPYKSYDYIRDRDNLVKTACLDSLTSKWLQEPHYRPLNYTYVDYILTTANNWRQPIKTFHLILDSNTETFHVSTCFAQNFNKISPTRLELTLNDFVPKNNITVYFLDIN